MLERLLGGLLGLGRLLEVQVGTGHLDQHRAVEHLQEAEHKGGRWQKGWSDTSTRVRCRVINIAQQLAVRQTVIGSKGGSEEREPARAVDSRRVRGRL